MKELKQYYEKHDKKFVLRNSIDISSNGTNQALGSETKVKVQDKCPCSKKPINLINLKLNYLDLENEINVLKNIKFKKDELKLAANTTKKMKLVKDLAIKRKEKKLTEDTCEQDTPVSPNNLTKMSIVH